MSTVLQRLLKHPHSAVFDKAPGAELALRVRHPDGCIWVIADEALVVTAGVVSRTYDLSGLSVGQLAAALVSDGFEVLSLSPDWLTRPAMALIEGQGDQGASNGDHIEAFTSILWVLLSGYAAEARAADYQVSQALRQMVITQAEGEWLDLWGALYSVGRLVGESDAAYAPRIPEEAFRVRVNGFAIENAIKDATGFDVEIREPWRRMFALDVSALSGGDHLHDADFYTYHIIQPVARAPFDWAPVLEVINRNRPAGVLVYSPSLEMPVRHVTASPSIPWQVQRSIESLYVMAAWQGGERPLGVMRLDDNEITLNHLMMAYQLRTFGVSDGLQGDQVFGRARNVAYASIALSDGVPLGDENAILSRGQLIIEFDPAPTLSDSLAASAYGAEFVARRVERILLSESAAWVGDVLVSAISEAAGRDDLRSAGINFYDGTNTWLGPWDTRSWLGWRHVGMAMTSTPM